MLFRKIMIFAGLAAFIFAIPGPVYAKGFFETLFGGRNKQATVKPEEKPVRPRVPRIARPKKPIVPHIILAGGTAFEILVVGDSLATNLWQGMSAEFKNHANVTVSRLTRNRTGLVRDDVYDWVKAVKTRIQTQKADIVIFMLGLNDNQRIPIPKKANAKTKTSKTALFSSPLWQEMYSARISTLLKFLRNKNIRVYWTGLPIMKKRALTEDISYLNSIFREQAELASVKFIDIWDAFANEEGAYARYSPDLSGRVRNMRAKNGIHFTNAGAKKLSHFVSREIYAEFGASALAQHDLANPADGSNPVSNIVLPPEKFIAAPMSPQPFPSAYAQAPRPRMRVREKQLYLKALIEGETLPSKIGRADDFSWPR